MQYYDKILYVMYLLHIFLPVDVNHMFIYIIFWFAERCIPV